MAVLSSVFAVRCAGKSFPSPFEQTLPWMARNFSAFLAGPLSKIADKCILFNMDAFAKTAMELAAVILIGTAVGILAKAQHILNGISEIIVEIRETVQDFRAEVRELRDEVRELRDQRARE